MEYLEPRFPSERKTSFFFGSRTLVHPFVSQPACSLTSLLFIFYFLTFAGAFRKEVIPELYKHISSSGQILNFRESIAMHKDAGNTDRLTARFVNIAFSSTGLRALDAKYRFPDGEAGNDLFNQGQKNHRTELGDREANWRPEFNNQIYGVILIAAESVAGVEEHDRLIWSIAGTQAEKIYTKNGVARENHEVR